MKKKLAPLANAPVEYNYMETLPWTYIIRERQNQFIQEKIFNNAAISRTAIAMNSISASTDSLVKNPV